MKWTRREKLLIGVIALLAIALIYTHFSLTDTKKQIADLQVQLSESETEANEHLSANRGLQEQITALESSNAALDTRYQSLSTNHTKLSSEYATLAEQKESRDTEYEQLSDTYRSEFSDIMGDLVDFEEKVQKSINWFRDNRDLGELKEWRNVKLELYHDCLRYDQGKCEIKLTCFPFINEHEYGVTYRTDESTTNKTDYLLSLEDIWKNQGGDCEDISSLFTAEYNYVVDRCEQLGYDRSDIVLTSFEYAPHSSTYITWDTDYYYFDNARSVDVTNGGNYMYIVCGLFPGMPAGHCVVGITAEKIESTADVADKLDGALLVEPQQGNYLGKVGETIKLYRDGDEIETPYFVSLVITEDDLKYFYAYTGENKWRGYSEFLSDIQDKKEGLRELWV